MGSISQSHHLETLCGIASTNDSDGKIENSEKEGKVVAVESVMLVGFMNLPVSCNTEICISGRNSWLKCASNLGKRPSQAIHGLCINLPLLNHERKYSTSTAENIRSLLSCHLKGYDGSLMGSINSLKTYQGYYNVSENDLAGTGIVFSIFQIGQMVGALFVWVSDWRGRRLSIFVGCLGVCIGALGDLKLQKVILMSIRNNCNKHSYDDSSVYWWEVSAVFFLHHCFNSSTIVSD